MGEIENEFFKLSHAWENNLLESHSPRQEERHFRQYLELSVELPEYKKDSGIVIPNYVGVADNFCVLLAVLFGKRFDNNGAVIQHGRIHLPSVNQQTQFHNKLLIFNNTKRRADYALDLNLSNFCKLSRFFSHCGGKVTKAHQTFYQAGRLYTQAIRIVEENPELAFLSLVTVGETLSSYFDYRSEDLLDKNTKSLLMEIKCNSSNGEEIYNKLIKKFSSIRAKFVLHLTGCLDDRFFTNSETEHKYNQLTKENISLRLRAAYDLRCKYVHDGKSGNSWLSVKYVREHEEVFSQNRNLGPIVEGDKEMQKIIRDTPTFLGLERIVRYALIKFLIKTQLIEDF